jgi:hypothetical protein
MKVAIGNAAAERDQKSLFLVDFLITGAEASCFILLGV